VNLWPNLTGGEVIDLLGRLRGGLDRGRRTELLERFALDPTKRCRAYSKGNRQKVALVAAFASDVELYLLDEPTSGLDPLMEAVFPGRGTGTARGRSGRAVLQPHPVGGRGAVRPGDDRPGGRAAESGTFDELRHLTRTSVLATTARPVDGLTAVPGVHDVSVEGTTVRLSVDQSQLNGVLFRLVQLDVRTIVCSPPTLEEPFLRHYGDDLVGAR
jgi:ABC-2 type transport system ATP-binding protein